MQDKAQGGDNTNLGPEKTVAAFLETNDILIADPQSSSRSSIASALSSLGAQKNRMLLVSSFGEAVAEIKRVKPKLVFCDFQIGKKSGLDLIQEQKAEYQASNVRNCFFILVTGNATQSTVARAAEEDVDTFILKPYTLGTFKKCLYTTIIGKLHPSEYIANIEKGKEKLLNGQAGDALTFFNKAKSLDPAPTLALYYAGQAEVLKASLEQANTSYQAGLKFNKIHYKCLTGLFDLMMKEKKYGPAYDIVKRISQYFPANPKRLSSVLRLAILTENYDDIEGYYRIFKSMDERSEELVRYMCSAMSITGKHYLRRSIKSRALDVFDKAAISAAGRTSFLRYIVETLVSFEYGSEAGQFLKRFPPESKTSPDYLISQLAVVSVTRPDTEIVKTGRAILDQGINDPLIFRILIKHSMKAGFKDSIDGLVKSASKLFPKKGDDFRKLYEDLSKGRQVSIFG